MASGGGEYQCGPDQWGRSHAVNSLGARGGAEQRCCRGERSGAGLRAPPARPGPAASARLAMAAAVDESALPSISTFANLMPLEERPADMLHVSTWHRGEGGKVGTGRSVPGWGSARPKSGGRAAFSPSEGAPRAAQRSRSGADPSDGLGGATAPSGRRGPRCWGSGCRRSASSRRS